MRGITLRGRGGVFCAGADLKGIRSGHQGGRTRAEVIEGSVRGAAMFDAVNTMPQVVIAVIEGAAMAGGFGLACCADVVICEAGAKFAMTETAIGLSPAQISPFVIQKLGFATARRLMLTAARFDGREAAELGFADFLAEDADGLNAIEARIRSQVLKCAPGAVADTKQLILAIPATRPKGRGHCCRRSIRRPTDGRGGTRGRRLVCREAQTPLGGKLLNGDISILLVANRGEIALRIMRTARAMGLRVVAVYSDADASTAHVRFADDAVRIGPPPVAESYLSIPAILAAAKQSGATAIHPGYGFLSENAAFARAVSDAGLTFVGPPPEAIEIMGDKARAKRAMIVAAFLACRAMREKTKRQSLPRRRREQLAFRSWSRRRREAADAVCAWWHRAADLPDALKQARSEAKNAFGSRELILERALQGARHVEVQVFADAHGATIHLGERDCSVQRRHQKVIEESPCPVMTPQLRERMGEAAVQAARAVEYRGAGTVEFLLDGDGNFYFLEMNTRLQVEHPVTEMVTGLDLVALQLRVARGEHLGLTQSAVKLNGSAIEARIYAEDPEAGFLPSTGTLLTFHTPPSSPGVRVDAGVESGDASFALV